MYCWCMQSHLWHHPVSQLPSESEGPRRCILTNNHVQNYCSTLLIRSSLSTPARKTGTRTPLGKIWSQCHQQAVPHSVLRQSVTAPALGHFACSPDLLHVASGVSQAQAPLVPPAVLLSISSSASQPKKGSSPAKHMALTCGLLL